MNLAPNSNCPHCHGAGKVEMMSFRTYLAPNGTPMRELSRIDYVLCECTQRPLIIHEENPYELPPPPIPPR